MMNSSGPAVCVTHADTMATAAAPETVISTGFISPASCTQNPLPKKKPHLVQPCPGTGHCGPGFGVGIDSRPRSVEVMVMNLSCFDVLKI